MEKNVFAGMEGLTLEGMKGLAGIGRQVGKLQLFRHGERWILLFSPPGRQGGKTFYLMGEKSRQPRLFAKADTALGIAAIMGIPGLWVSFSEVPLHLKIDFNA
jgi:hypothetical protein